MTKARDLADLLDASGNIIARGNIDGRDVASDGSKLDSIEHGATGDQTHSEIRALIVAGVDTNVFTDADHSKLDGIEAGATADQTAAEIKTSYESNANTNEFSDAEQSKLAGIEAGATADQTKADIDALNVDADTLDGQHGSYYTSYADTAVANIVDSAPGTLDTLNELAAALGDDPNFATTTATNIGTKANKTITVSAGNGLTGGGDLTANRTISHADTSTVTDVDGSGNTFIQDIGFDTYGHVTSVGTGTVTVGDGAMTVTAGSGLSGGGQLGTANQSGASSVTVSHADTSSQASVDNSNGTVIQDITLDTYGHITGIASTNLDGRYYTESEADSRFVNVTGDTMTGNFTVPNLGIGTTSITDSNWGTGNTELAIDGGSEYGVIHLRGTGAGSVDTRYSIGVGDSKFYMAYDDVDGVHRATINSSHQLILNEGSGEQRAFHDGYHPNADKWTTARTLSLSGDASGSVSWDGSGNATLSVAVANDSHTHGKLDSSYSGVYASADSAMPSTIRSFSHDLGVGINDGHLLSMTWGSTTSYGAQIWVDTDPTGAMGVRQRNSSGTWTGWYNIWTSGNDGSGSGLDADLLDGVQGSSYLRSDVADSMSGDLSLTSQLIVGGLFGHNAYNTNASSTIYLGGGNDRANYSIGTEMQNYGGNYTKLDLRWHTGIRMFARTQYGGLRYYTDSAMNTEIFSIGRGDSHVRVTNNLYANQFHGDGSNLTGIDAGAPAGSIIYHAGSSAPSGYIKANGASLSTSTYSALFSAIGYTYGGSGGSFNVPDLRGEFIRGWDDGRGVDSGRSFGSYQADDFGSHTHTAYGAYSSTWFSVYARSGNWGSERFITTNSYQTGSAGAADTRPRNRAMLACIKI